MSPAGNAVLVLGRRFLHPKPIGRTSSPPSLGCGRGSEVLMSFAISRGCVLLGLVALDRTSVDQLSGHSRWDHHGAATEAWSVDRTSASTASTRMRIWPPSRTPGNSPRAIAARTVAGVTPNFRATSPTLQNIGSCAICPFCTILLRGIENNRISHTLIISPRLNPHKSLLPWEERWLDGRYPRNASGLFAYAFAFLSMRRLTATCPWPVAS